VAAKRQRPNRPKASKPRSEAQKLRRKELWLAREADRRQAAEARYLARYEELKLEMARHGQTIGTLADALAHTDPAHRFEVIKARVERWDALWSITLRKRDTRGKIVLGGAVLAELAYLSDTDAADREFRRRLVDLLDRRVLRIRDRLLIRDLATAASRAETPLPLRPGGSLSEGLADALKAIGEGFTPFDAEALAMTVGDQMAEAEAEASDMLAASLQAFAGPEDDDSQDDDFVGQPLDSDWSEDDDRDVSIMLEEARRSHDRQGQLDEVEGEPIEPA
jgi:hypothetical protein